MPKRNTIQAYQVNLSENDIKDLSLKLKKENSKRFLKNVLLFSSLALNTILIYKYFFENKNEIDCINFSLFNKIKNDIEKNNKKFINLENRFNDLKLNITLYFNSLEYNLDSCLIYSNKFNDALHKFNDFVCSELNLCNFKFEDLKEIIENKIFESYDDIYLKNFNYINPFISCLDKIKINIYNTLDAAYSNICEKVSNNKMLYYSCKEIISNMFCFGSEILKK
jgi:hypothetical protein